jgi:hypothetical protein
MSIDRSRASRPAISHSTRQRRARVARLLEMLESRVLLSAAFSNGDLNGTWNLNSENSFGTIQFDGMGNISGGSLTDSSGDPPSAPSGTYSVSSNGAVTIEGGSPTNGQMNSTKDVVAATSADTDTIGVLVNSSRASFSNTDMAGTWTVVFNGDAADSNGDGTLIFNSTGGVTGGTVTDGHGTEAVTGGSYTLNANGTLAVTVQTHESNGNNSSITFAGAMNDSKDFVGLTPSEGLAAAVANQDSLLIMLVHSTGNFSDADAAGTWSIFSDDTTGTATLDGAGHITGGNITDGQGDTFALSGSYTVSASGALTLNITSTPTSPGNQIQKLNFTGALNTSKNTIIMNIAGANTSDDAAILIGNADHAPTLSTISTFSTATEQKPFAISYDSLLAASNAHDADGDPISFVITSLGSGTLTVDGGAVTAGTTTVSSGDTLMWTPAAGTQGLATAFSVEASDGTLTSTIPVAVKVNTVLLPSVTISATKNASQLNPTTTGQGDFVLTRTGGDLTQPLTVDYTVGGNATSGVDYDALSGNVTFAPESKTATVLVTPVDNGLAKANETVSLTLVQDEGVTYSLGTKSAANITITNDAPTISIAANKPKASELNPSTTGQGQFTLTRTGLSVAGPLTVDYSILGSATNGQDYVMLSGQAVFAAGSKTATINLTPIDDVVIEGTQTVVLTLAADAGPSYFIGPKNSATVTITDHLISPASLTGDTLSVTISSGSAPFAAVGTYQLLLSPTNNSYLLIGATGVPSSSGTYTYTKIGSATGRIAIDDASIGTGNITLTFFIRNRGDALGGGRRRRSADGDRENCLAGEQGVFARKPGGTHCDGYDFRRHRRVFTHRNIQACAVGFERPVRARRDGDDGRQHGHVYLLAVFA